MPETRTSVIGSTLASIIGFGVGPPRHPDSVTRRTMEMSQKADLTATLLTLSRCSCEAMRFRMMPRWSGAPGSTSRANRRPLYQSATLSLVEGLLTRDEPPTGRLVCHIERGKPVGAVQAVGS